MTASHFLENPASQILYQIADLKTVKANTKAPNPCHRKNKQTD